MVPSTPDLPVQPIAADAPVIFPCAECGRTLRAKPEAAGTRLRCPHCKKAVLVPNAEPALEADVVVDDSPAPARRATFPFGGVTAIVASIAMVATIAGCAVYANLSFAVTNRVNYKYFPPFKPFVNANSNDHLGAEYYNIAKAMVAGEGFSSPFKEKTGPTAWMPPVLPTVLAALLLLCDGNQDAVMTIVICLQVFALNITGLLVVALAWQSTKRLTVVFAAAFFVVMAIGDFRQWFQNTHDCWIILLALDAVVAGFAWAAPLDSKTRAAGWGVWGGLIALVSPIAGFAWGVICLALIVRKRAWKPGAIAILVAGLTLTPWMVRNYLVFGRLIPVKSNAAYELWQSQCATPDGLLQTSVFGGHPYASAGRERQQYKLLGEIAFLDQKQKLFWDSVAADRLDFLDRVACRGLGATLWYVPSDRVDGSRRVWVLWISRVLFPLPFLAMLFLLATAFIEPMHPVQWIGIGAYMLYLTPYIAVSYYDRYAMPLLGVKVLLVVWAADRVLSLIWPPKPQPL
jgi:hypothetical protein